MLPHHFNPSGVSETVVELCNHEYTIASELRKKPTSSVHAIWESLYPKPFVLKRLVNRFTIKHDLYHGRGDPTKEDLDRAEKCGKFPYRPSDLFLKIFSDVLLCLERDPLSDMCAPPLIGTSGVIPLSIISVIPDIMQHYYDCIIRAEREVVLATNYWQPSQSVNKISSALMYLSKLAGERRQTEKIVVKIMWDRGQFSQMIDNHARVTEEGMEALDLPRPDEIPNIDLQVINFHRPLLGTYHIKFLVVDRKIALLNSNNIQDRPNLEMMIHLEGAVVESFYDIFLFSWHHSMSPVLPCVMEPPTTRRDHTAKATDFEFQEQNPYLSEIELVKAAKAARAMLQLEKNDDDRIATLRGNTEKEGIFGGYGGRFQAALGAITESRRGSFSADTRDQELLREEAIDAAQKPGGSHIKFADAVFKAMDARRKGFLSGSKSDETHDVDTNESAGPSRSTSVHRGQPPASHAAIERDFSNKSRNASTTDAPSLVNWNQANGALEEMLHLDSPAQAKANADHARYLASPQPAHVSRSEEDNRLPNDKTHRLLTLNLPGSSLKTPNSSKAPSIQSNAAGDDAIAARRSSHDQNSIVVPNAPTSTTRSEGSSAGHPTSALEASEPSTAQDRVGGANTLGSGVSMSSGTASALPMHIRDYAASDQANTPALSQSTYSAATTASSKGPETPPTTSSGPTIPANHITSSTLLSEHSVTSRTKEDATSGNATTKPGFFSHVMDSDGNPLTNFRFSKFAERRNQNISTGSSSAGSKPPPKKNWIEGLVLGKGAKAGPPVPPPEVQTPRQRALSSALNAGALSAAWSTVEDSELLDEFNPHTLHRAHNPFPIAMVNRKPHGLPGHQDIRVPQDAAWLAGIRYAKKSVFIQTPTFNAKPIVAACIDACRRGIQVTLYGDLGFNDQGESMPFQGGTNEQVVERMYKELRRTGHQQNLHAYWYTGKDQARPLNAVKKQRNCHVKFMQIDDQVAIQGNGNQDTQSWYHSAEVNVMVDSALIVKDWMETLNRQQNTLAFGKIDDDGIWRDPATGKTAAEMDAWEAEQRAAGIKKPVGAAALNGEPMS